MQEVDLEEALLWREDGRAPRMADIRWGATDLSLLEWGQVCQLGDESYAEQLAKQSNVSQKKKVKVYREAVRGHVQLVNALQQQGIEDATLPLRYRGKVLLRKLFWIQGARKR
jgi:hypothetical protein